ncbi:MAG: EVE domain-containing protein [Saprospiraceae bacterium]|nr:EVE domain-containing protein [Saprospiraceae bacterium]
MNYWLVKSEPETYSYDRLEKEGKTMWEGVRNYAARNHLRAMKMDDLVLFYHSLTGLEVVGICKVSKEAYPDPTAEKGDWSVVDLVPVKRLNKPVSLATVKATPELQNTALVRIGRLSVMPLEKMEFEQFLELGETKL